MPELLPGQAAIIDRGVEVDFPLGQITEALGVPVKFSVDMRWFFTQVALKYGELTQLVPDVVVDGSYDYDKALVVKLGNRPMLAICTGEDRSEYLENIRPIAVVFNLLRPEKQGLVVFNGWQLYNNDNPVGGLDLSELVGKDLLNEVLEVTAVGDGVALAVTQHVGA